MYIQISEIEKDLLREMLSVGVSKAADAFSGLIQTHQGITLTVPAIKVIEPEDFSPGFPEYGKIVLVLKTQLQGDLAGVTLLLVSEEQIDWIIENCLTAREQQYQDQAALQQGLLLELSNILTGAIVTQLADLLKLETVGLPPESITPDSDKTLESLLCLVPPCQPILLSVRTNLRDQNKAIELPLLMALESSSLFRMLHCIRQRDVYEYKLLKKRA